MTIVINVDRDGYVSVDYRNNNNWTQEHENYCLDFIFKKLSFMFGHDLGMKKSDYKSAKRYELGVLGRINNEIYLLLHNSNLNKYLKANHIVPNIDVRKRLDYVVGREYLDNYEFSNASINSLVNRLNVLKRTKNWSKAHNKDYSAKPPKDSNLKKFNKRGKLINEKNKENNQKGQFKKDPDNPFH